MLMKIDFSHHVCQDQQSPMCAFSYHHSCTQIWGAMSAINGSKILNWKKRRFPVSLLYLKAVFAPPPRGVFFRRHVNHRHNVADLQGAEDAHLILQAPLKCFFLTQVSFKDQYGKAFGSPQRTAHLRPGRCNA